MGCGAPVLYHKILSGRMAEFDELRQYGGLSGFPKRKESPYDSFDTGHSSTSISAGLGIAWGAISEVRTTVWYPSLETGPLPAAWRMKL